LLKTPLVLKISLAALILLCLVSAVTFILLKEQQTEKTNQAANIFKDNNITVYNFSDYDLIIVSFEDNFDFIYDSSPYLSVNNFAKKYNYRYLINGSFFEPSKAHAGWLYVLGQTKTQLKKDPQLSHVVRLNYKTGQIDFIQFQQFQPSESKNDLEFQTGPLIIERNQIKTNYIQQSFNGLSPYKRTLLAYTEEDRRKYFIIVKRNTKLDQLSKYLLTLSVFSGKTLSVINLDGGPSVAMFSKTYPELNFNETAILPILLGVK
jgi:hypothetical protein